MTHETNEKVVQDAVAFHGHLCPMSVLGARMGLFALRKLGAKRATGIKLIGIVYNDLCAVDGFQFVTGCTTGKRTLIVRDYGMLSADLFDVNARKGIHVSLKVLNELPDVMHRALDYGAKMQAFVKRSFDSVEERKNALRRLNDEAAEIVVSVENITDEELFNARDIEFVAPPPQTKDMTFAGCANCGEIGLREHLTKRGDEYICRICMEKGQHEMQ